MYKPGSVSDYLNKNKNNVAEDSTISKFFKDESEISQIFPRKKVYKVHEIEKENTPKSSETGEEQEKVAVKKLSNAGRRIDAKSHREMLKMRRVQDTRTVFVGNVPLNATKKDLMELFKKCGKIESIRFRSVPTGDMKLPKKAVEIKKAYHPKGVSKNAYVVFVEDEMAQEATTLNNSTLLGMHLRVDSAATDNKARNDRSVFVGNLPFNCDEESLRRLFEECGVVEGVRVVRDKKTLIGKGFAYVAFEEESSVELAVRMDACEFNKRKLRVQRCLEKKEVGGVGGGAEGSIGGGAKDTVKGGVNGVVKGNAVPSNKIDLGNGVLVKKRWRNEGITWQSSDADGGGRKKKKVVGGSKEAPVKGSDNMAGAKKGGRKSASKFEGKSVKNKVGNDSKGNISLVENGENKKKSKKQKLKDVPETSAPPSSHKKKAKMEDKADKSSKDKKSKKEVLQKKLNLMAKRVQMAEKKKKAKKVIRQEVLKRKKSKLGKLLSKQ